MITKTAKALCMCATPHDRDCPVRRNRYYATLFDDNCVNEYICEDCGADTRTEWHSDRCLLEMQNQASDDAESRGDQMREEGL